VQVPLSQYSSVLSRAPTRFNTRIVNPLLALQNSE
jgi:hypothetical protein